MSEAANKLAAVPRPPVPVPQSRHFPPLGQALAIFAEAKRRLDEGRAL